MIRTEVGFEQNFDFGWWYILLVQQGTEDLHSCLIVNSLLLGSKQDRMYILKLKSVLIKFKVGCAPEIVTLVYNPEKTPEPDWIQQKKQN